MRILIASSEVAPWSKTGGLGDVAAALPAALARLPDTEVHVVSPAHRVALRRLAQAGVALPSLTAGDEPIRSFLDGAGFRHHLHHAPELWDRDGLYDEGGTPWPDNYTRFARFGRAIANLAAHLQADVVQLNDWQTATYFLHADAAERPTLIAIHNLAFQGEAMAEHLLPLTAPRLHSVLRAHTDAAGRCNLLGLAIALSDATTTVSPTYAREILTEELGHGLHNLLRTTPSRVEGILNGVDPTWDPRLPEHLAAPYEEPGTPGHHVCRADLLRRCGWRADDRPIAAVVSRLAHQKGIDLLQPALEPLLAAGRLRLAVLGSGEESLAATLQQLAGRWPDAVDVCIRYDEAHARRLLAGSDFFLMPSRFEPCGLTQMYAMRYGCIPIVRSTGGLADTVLDVRLYPRRGTGLAFRESTPDALRTTLEAAISLRDDEEVWNSLRRRAMKQDFGWAASARLYRNLYGDIWSRHRTRSEVRA